jgi:hypothetical protein
VCLAGASTAHAEPKDAAALALASEAIDTHYLATDFASAERKLREAIALCGGDRCSKSVRARVHRDLGLVLVVAKKTDEGRAAFVSALQADPTVGLEPDLVTPEVQTTFDAARQSLGGDAVAPAAPPPPAPPGKGLVHTPPAEQAVLTPVPIYVELAAGVEAPARVELSYKAPGAQWKKLSMKRVREGWGELLPCLDVGGSTGKLSYWVRAVRDDGTVVASAGSAEAPWVVTIVRQLAGDPPHLPGSPPPAQCADPADCPPGLPGCPGQGAEAEGGGASDCVAAGTCPDAVGDQGKRTANWVSLTLQQDVLLIGSSTRACSEGSDYACFDSGDAYYDRVPYEGQGGEISGGMRLATTRIVLGYERAIIAGLSLGVRLGFAFRGGPAAPGGSGFVPLHAEGRAAWWFGGFAPRTGPRFFVAASGGVAQVDAEIPVVVYDNETDFMADRRTSYNAWRKTGTGFAALGAGALVALTPSSGALAELRVMQMLGISATVVAPQLGYAVGF